MSVAGGSHSPPDADHVVGGRTHHPQADVGALRVGTRDPDQKSDLVRRIGRDVVDGDDPGVAGNAEGPAREILSSTTDNPRLSRRNRTRLGRALDSLLTCRFPHEVRRRVRDGRVNPSQKAHNPSISSDLWGHGRFASARIQNRETLLSALCHHKHLI